MKKKNLFINLVILVMAVSLVIGLSACNPSDPSSDSSKNNSYVIDNTEGLLISNSDFNGTSNSKVYPYLPKDWKGSVMTSSLPAGVTAGTINVNEEIYDDYKSTWDDLDNPGKAEGSSDDKMLMIYMPEKADSDDAKHGPTAYGYTSNSFTITQYDYYKLSVSVKTVNIEGGDDAGARIYLSTSAYVDFHSIDTEGEWTTYTIYIEGSASKDYTLTVNLSLGYYSSSISSAQLTTGYVFFDNLVLEKLEPTEDKTPYEQYSEAVTNDTTKKITYLVPNGEFDYGTTVSGSSSAQPSLWSAVTGGSSTSFSAPTTYRYNGLLDVTNYENLQSKLSTTRYIYTPEVTFYTLEEWNGLTEDEQKAYDSVSDVTEGEYAGGKKAVKNKVSAMDYTKNVVNPSTPAGSSGNSVYMLSQVYMTAQGITSSTPLVVEKGSYTAISVRVYTQHIFGAGVSILLSGNGDDFGFVNISKTTYTKDSSGDEVEVYQVYNTSTSDFDYYNSKGEKLTVSDYNPGTTGGWATYTFYIKGNAYMDTSFTMELWLGTGDTSENTKKTIDSFTSSGYASKASFSTYTSDGTFSKGFVFFDNVTISKVTEEDYRKATASADYSTPTDDRLVNGDANQTYAIDLALANDLASANGSFENSTQNADIPYDDLTLGTPDGWTTTITDGQIDGVYLSPDTVAGVVDTTNQSLFESLGLTSPGVPFDYGSNKVLMVYSPTGQIYKFESQPFTLEQNNCYRVSVWMKTENMPSSSGLRISLYDADTDTSLKSSSVINTTDYKKYHDNDWIEYTFVIKGYSDKSINASLVLEYGYGDRWASTTHGKGAGYFANVSVMNIPLTTYTTLSSNTTNSTSISYQTTESGKTVANSAFDLIDLDNTQGMQNGKLLEDVGVPLNWTATDKKISSDDVLGGIIQFNTDDNKNFYADAAGQIATLAAKYPVLSSLGTTTSSIYDMWTNPNGGPNALLIANVDGTDKFSLGYTSKAISLSANSYYKISVWAYTNGGSTLYSLYLTSENPVTNYFEEAPYFVTTSTNAGWTEYTFYVEVGLNAISATLDLWLGVNTDVVSYANAEDAKTTGYVVYDSVSCLSITEEEFNEYAAATENQRKISFLTDGFDAASTDASSKSSLTSVTGWTSKIAEVSNLTDIKSGIYYYSGVEGDYEISDLFGLDLKGTLDQEKGTHYQNNADSKEFIPISDTVGKLYSDVACTTLSETGIYYKRAENDVVTLKTTTVDDTQVLAKYTLNTEDRNNSFIPYENLATRSGNYALAINNTVESSYYYVSSKYSFTADSYYKVSVFVKTYGVSEGTGAYVRLSANGLNYTTAEKTFSKINSEAWTEYTFYVKTADEALSDITVELGLGEYDTATEDKDLLAKGYAMFDDFSIEKIDEAAYDDATEGDALKKFEATESDVSTGDPDSDGTGTVPYTPDLSYLWWMIPTIILVLAVIIVIIVLVVRKIKAKMPEKESVKSASYSSESTTNENIEQKKDIYSSFEENSVPTPAGKKKTGKKKK